MTDIQVPMNPNFKDDKAAYMPLAESLKFIAFIRACNIEENTSPEIHYMLADKYFSKDKQVLIEAFRGSAKALALDELVYLANGKTKTIGEVSIGDEIYGDDGKLTKVISKSEVFKNKDSYRVELSDGRSVVCSDDHLWTVSTRGNNSEGLTKDSKTLTTKEMFDTQYYAKKVTDRNPDGLESKYYLPLTKPIQYTKNNLPIDPYTLGVIIGDGSVDKDSGFSRVSSHISDATELKSYIPYEKGKNSTPYTSCEFFGIKKIGPEIKKLGLNVNTYNKFIPEIYKYSSIEDRIELLRGLMDTDGTAGKFASSFCTVNKKLAEDFYELCTGLGLRVVKSFGENNYIGYYRIHLTHRNFNPFKLLRKANVVEYKKCTSHQKIKRITKVTSVYSQCLMVDNESKLFLTTNNIVTHNSTLMEWFVVYAAVMGEVTGFGPVSFIAFIGDSMDNGVKNFFRNISSKIDQSALLRSLLTIKRGTDSEMELVNADGHELDIKGWGAGGNIRGVRYKNRRPDIVILDDITTNEAKTSDAIQKTINDNFYKAVVPALHPTRYKMFFIGTPISENDLLHQLSNNSEWVVHKFPVCETFPCDPKDFVGFWEDRFTYKAVKEKYDMLLASGKAQDFYQEYMLEITDLSTLLVEEDDIRWFDPKMLIKNKHLYNFYISTDFATSSKKSADFSTIGVWAVSSDDNWLLIDGQCKRQDMQSNLEDLLRYVSKWRPLSVGIESSGQQGGFISILEEMMMQRNVWFQIARKKGSKDPGIRPVKDKVHRFVTGVQPKFKQNKIWLPKPELIQDKPYLAALLEEMVHELSKFTLAGGVKALAHDDAIDLLNQLSEMEIFSPESAVSGEGKTIVDDSGLMWTSDWDGDDSPVQGGSLIF